jgi:hypothetical protein
LGLDNTSLQFLPPELGTLPHLERLGLRNTPMKMIPIEIYQKGIESVLKFLASFSLSDSVFASDYEANIAWLFDNPNFSDLKFVDSSREISKKFLMILQMEKVGIFTNVSFLVVAHSF